MISEEERDAILREAKADPEIRARLERRLRQGPSRDKAVVCLTIEGLDCEAWIPAESYTPRTIEEATNTLLEFGRAHGVTEEYPVFWMETWPDIMDTPKSLFPWLDYV